VTTTFHVCLSVRGYLAGPERDLENLFKDGSGRFMSTRMAKEELMKHLAAGREVLPIGQPCDGFDFSGGGCPGHKQKEKAVTVMQERREHRSERTRWLFMPVGRVVEVLKEKLWR